MESSVLRRLHALRRMSTDQLREEWMRQYGELPRSRNREHLWKRLAWRVQEQAYGGLSDGARARIEQLIPDDLLRARKANVGRVEADPGPKPGPLKPRRDPRLPAPGTVITKTYKGTELRVLIREDGLELNGTNYPSATALAKAITGSKSINGWLFLGITKRKRGG